MAGEKSLNIKIIPPKEFLPYIFVGVAGILSLLLLILAVSEIVSIKNKIKEGKQIGKNTISITGQGKVLVKPEIGQIDLAVVTEAKTVSVAQTENTSKMNKIIKAMKDLGIKEEDLKTVSYNINPRYQYKEGKSEIIGYEASQTLRVKIRDLEKVGQILEKGASLGANQVGSLEFTFDEPEKLKDEAREKAISNAKKKAEDLVKVLGVKLGKVVSFTEITEPVPIPFYHEAKSLGGGGETPQIQTSQNEIEARVILTYEIY